jgi:hypothetical protein
MAECSPVAAEGRLAQTGEKSARLISNSNAPRRRSSPFLEGVRMRNRTLFAALAFATLVTAGLSLGAAQADTVGQTFWAAGTYHTTVRAGNEMAHMKLVITQNGNSVSGTYGTGGSISGMMNQGAFAGRYKDSSGNGWVRFQFSNGTSGKTFVGNYGSSPGIVAGTWSGTTASGTSATRTHATETDTHVPATGASPAPMASATPTH